MLQTLQTIFEELGINPNEGGERELNVLQAWCHEHLSTDARFEGDDAYHDCIEYVQEYHQVFLPLIANDASVDGMNAIQYAAWQGYDVYLNGLKPTTPEVLSQSSDAGMTPLHLAAIKGHVQTLETLLGLGADPNKRNGQQQLPIHSTLSVPMFHASDLIANKESIFNKLKSCTDVELTKDQDANGDTLLHMMASADIGSDTFLSLLRECLSNTNYKDLVFCNNNQSHYPIHIAFLNKKEGMVDLFLDVPDVASLRDNSGQVALHYAVTTHASDPILLKCIQATPDINVHNRNAESALMVAVAQGNHAAKDLLIEHHADTHGIRSRELS